MYLAPFSAGVRAREMHRLLDDLSVEEFILGSIESNSPRERRSEVDFLLRFIIGDLADGTESAGNVLAKSNAS